MAKLETISGRITHVGKFSSDAHCHTYSLLEIEAGESRQDLSAVVAANELSRAIQVGKQVAMSVLLAGSGKNAKSIILGIYDVAEQRTFLNEVKRSGF